MSKRVMFKAKFTVLKINLKDKFYEGYDIRREQNLCARYDTEKQ